MQAGDILLFKGEDGISKWIQWGTGSEYSHVAVCVSSEMNLAIEAMAGGGVRARDIRLIPENYDIYRIKEKEECNINGTISFLVSKLNNKYDYLGVIFLGFLKVLAKLGIPVKNRANKWQKKKDYFCSELCYEAFYRGGGIDIVPDVDTADITSPGDIARSKRIERVYRNETGGTRIVVNNQKKDTPNCFQWVWEKIKKSKIFSITIILSIVVMLMQFSPFLHCTGIGIQNDGKLFVYVRNEGNISTTHIKGAICFTTNGNDEDTAAGKNITIPLYQEFEYKGEMYPTNKEYQYIPLVIRLDNKDFDVNKLSDHKHFFIYMKYVKYNFWESWPIWFPRPLWKEYRGVLYYTPEGKWIIQAPNIYPNMFDQVFEDLKKGREPKFERMES